MGPLLTLSSHRLWVLLVQPRILWAGLKYFLLLPFLLCCNGSPRLAKLWWSSFLVPGLSPRDALKTKSGAQEKLKSARRAQCSVPSPASPTPPPGPVWFCSWWGNRPQPPGQGVSEEQKNERVGTKGRQMLTLRRKERKVKTRERKSQNENGKDMADEQKRTEIGN